MPHRAAAESTLLRQEVRRGGGREAIVALKAEIWKSVRCRPGWYK